MAGSPPMTPIAVKKLEERARELDAQRKAADVAAVEAAIVAAPPVLGCGCMYCQMGANFCSTCRLHVPDGHACPPHEPAPVEVGADERDVVRQLAAAVGPEIEAELAPGVDTVFFGDVPTRDEVEARLRDFGDDADLDDVVRALICAERVSSAFVNGRAELNKDEALFHAETEDKLRRAEVRAASLRAIAEAHEKTIAELLAGHKAELAELVKKHEEIRAGDRDTVNKLRVELEAVALAARNASIYEVVIKGQRIWVAATSLDSALAKAREAKPGDTVSSVKLADVPFIA